MEKITVPFITGDGVGAEITPSMQAVVNAALKKAYGDSRSIEWKEVLAGERAFNETGSWLPEETMDKHKPHHLSQATLCNAPFLLFSLSAYCP